MATFLRIPSDSNRTFICNESRDIDALYCVLLGRRPESREVRERYLGLPILAAADAIIGSEEFALRVMKSRVRLADLPHGEFGIEEWQLVLEFLPASGFLFPARSEEEL